jgi:hypothetical protein
MPTATVRRVIGASDDQNPPSASSRGPTRTLPSKARSDEDRPLRTVARRPLANNRGQGALARRSSHRCSKPSHADGHRCRRLAPLRSASNSRRHDQLSGFGTVRAYRARALWVYIVRSCRPRQMVAVVPSKTPLFSAHLLHLQRSGWQWLEQCGLGFAAVEPRPPILALKDDHLASMDRRNVRAGSRRQQREGAH